MAEVKVIRKLAGKLLYIFIGFCLGFIIFRFTNVNNRITDYSGTRLFYDVHSIGRTGTYEESLQSAAKLARDKNMSDWLIVFLMDANAIDYSLDEFVPDPNEKQKMKKEFMKIENAMISTLIENIPDDSPKPVLFALTTKLADNGIGITSKTSEIFPFRKFYDGKTPPIKDVARETLKRCLKADYGYDIYKWRDAIININ